MRLQNGVYIDDVTTAYRLNQSIPASFTVWKDDNVSPTLYRAESNLEGVDDISGTDAAAVIQAASDALSVGEKLFFKANCGKMQINTTIIPKSQTCWEGEWISSWAQPIPAAQFYNNNELTTILDLADVSHFGLEKLMFLSDNTTYDQALNWDTGSKWITVDRCMIEDFYIGIWIHNDGWSSTIKNSIFANTRSMDINATSVNFNDVLIDRNLLNRLTYIAGGNGIKITNNNFEEIAIQHCLELAPATTGIWLAGNRVEYHAGSVDYQAWDIYSDYVKIEGGQHFSHSGPCTNPAIVIRPEASFVDIDEGSLPVSGFTPKVMWLGASKIRNSGTATGTGAQQTIAHGCSFTPTASEVFLSERSTGLAVPYQSAAPDVTNIYVLATLNKDYNWKVETA